MTKIPTILNDKILKDLNGTHFCQYMSDFILINEMKKISLCFIRNLSHAYFKKI